MYRQTFQEQIEVVADAKVDLPPAYEKVVIEA